VISCIKAGSPSKATKALAESYLKPTLKLVEYAGSLSRKKQSALLRDLKLGVNHIDIDQLRRNALLSPRYPTELLDLSANVEDIVETPDAKGVELFGVSNTVFKVKCCATVSLVAPDDDLLGQDNYRTDDGLLAETYKEEWVVYRSLKEFQILHKHLKMQVSAMESSGTAGSRLVGAATAAFAATTASIGRTRQRKMLIPSLSQASKAGALGVTKKVIFKRKEILDGYLGYILSPGHLLGRCSELLLFLGASFPLDPSVRVGTTIHTTGDLLGRTEMTRSVLQLKSDPQPDFTQNETTPRTASSAASVDSQDEDMMLDDDIEGDQNRKFDNKDEMKNLAVRSKIDKVRLPLVRTRIFDLLRYQFGFENASFARNRLLAALKTASFAVTSAADFRKTLYKLHIEHFNSGAIAGWIDMLTEMLWPNGKFFESTPPLSPEEIQAQVDQAKELLHGNFPDQVRAILGSELTRDGLDIFHEMLQNRLVVKSMAYMLFDHLWLEVFPEIGDVLSCGAAIDADAKEY
jgi:Sorting nexin C terminal